MTHTTGPWTIENGCICAPNGRALLAVDAIGGETEAEVAGNVAMIAAAPKLLEALEDLLADISGLSDEFAICREILQSSYGKAANAAVKKARAA